jgi:hypothetical protein
VHDVADGDEQRRPQREQHGNIRLMHGPPSSELLRVTASRRNCQSFRNANVASRRPATCFNTAEQNRNVL